jgi:hypothetical protein
LVQGTKDGALSIVSGGRTRRISGQCAAENLSEVPMRCHPDTERSEAEGSGFAFFKLPIRRPAGYYLTSSCHPESAATKDLQLFIKTRWRSPHALLRILPECGHAASRCPEVEGITSTPPQTRKPKYRFRHLCLETSVVGGNGDRRVKCLTTTGSYHELSRMYTKAIMDEEQDKLVNDIEEITARIEKLEPQVYEEEAKSGTASSNRSTLMDLRNELARKTERLNALCHQHQ